MELTFAPRGILQIDDARIIYRNFSGKPSKYNREGDRNFAIVIPDEDTKDALIEAGWNVKIKPPRCDSRDEKESPFMLLPVKIHFNDRGPKVYLKTAGKMTRLYEDEVARLDDVDIEQVDLDIRPYDWDVNGKVGRTAYLQSICVTQALDRFAAKYAEEDNESIPMF